jgi:hypothetical protein
MSSTAQTMHAITAADVDDVSILAVRDVAAVEACVCADEEADLYLCTVPMSTEYSTMVHFRATEERPAALVQAMPTPARFQGVGPTIEQQREAKRLWKSHGGLAAPRELLTLLFDERPLTADRATSLEQWMTAEAVTFLRDREAEGDLLQMDASIGSVTALPTPTLLERFRAALLGDDLRYQPSILRSRAPSVAESRLSQASVLEESILQLQQQVAADRAQAQLDREAARAQAQLDREADQLRFQQNMEAMQATLATMMQAMLTGKPAASPASIPPTADTHAIQVLSEEVVPSDADDTDEDVDVEGQSPPATIEEVAVTISQEPESVVASPNEPTAHSVPIATGATRPVVTLHSSSSRGILV